MQLDCIADDHNLVVSGLNTKIPVLLCTCATKIDT